MSEDLPIQVEISDMFVRRVRTLKKRYRNIRKDIEPVIQQLSMGEVLGDRISGVEAEVYKVRVRNRDIQKGKSAGYRLIYYLQLETKIVLLTIYSKSDQSDISDKDIREILGGSS
ncbi:type II toxin-antitoxin system RelE/ParE family toxin [Geitlerinema sp. CS-897]|nr:type II toxin-antitoxin system RelE/ParE family toxin [Geitlerinema sp. CS-897]